MKKKWIYIVHLVFKGGPSVDVVGDEPYDVIRRAQQVLREHREPLANFEVNIAPNPCVD